jgi:hypothetical protein
VSKWLRYFCYVSLDTTVCYIMPGWAEPSQIGDERLLRHTVSESDYAALRRWLDQFL